MNNTNTKMEGMAKKFGIGLSVAMLGLMFGPPAEAQVQHKSLILATGIPKRVAAVARIAPIPDYQIAVDSNAILNLDAKPLDVANREAAARAENEKALAENEKALAENEKALAERSAAQKAATAESLRMQLRDAQLHLSASELEYKQAVRAKNSARIKRAKYAVAMDKTDIINLQAKLREQD